MSTAEKVHKEIVGVRQGGIESDPDTGWTTFSIAVDGWEHPVKLSTKKPDLIGMATAVGKQTATWGFLESDGKPNPHGGFYKNRWLADVTPLGLDQPEAQTEMAQASKPAESPPPSSSPMSKAEWAEKDLRKHRQAAVAISVSSYEHDPTVSEQGILARAQRFVNYVYQGPEDLVAAAEAGMADADDIPFE